jgi:hypothetical protein
MERCVAAGGISPTATFFLRHSEMLEATPIVLLAMERCVPALYNAYLPHKAQIFVPAQFSGRIINAKDLRRMSLRFCPL